MKYFTARGNKSQYYNCEVWLISITKDPESTIIGF